MSIKTDPRAPGLTGTAATAPTTSPAASLTPVPTESKGWGPKPATSATVGTPKGSDFKPASTGSATALAKAGAASVNGTNTQPISLSADQKGAMVKKKGTCPFLGSAMATGALAVRNSADKPLASIDDVVKLGNSGGGDLGNVLKVFAEGNHAMMPGPSGKLDQKVPAGTFSLDLPGSQGSHPGHSGILQGNPLMPNSGRFSDEDFSRLTSRAKNGYLKRSDVAKFIAENLAKDPNAKVFQGSTALKLGGDLLGFASTVGPALMESLTNKVEHKTSSDAHRQVYEALTKTLGEDNLVGSSGEFGLMMAFLAHSPNTKTIDGEPALSLDDVTKMFKDKQFPAGWETWPKTSTDWVTNSTALSVEAAKEYLKLKHAA